MNAILPSLGPYLFGLFTGASSIGFLALVMHRRRCEMKGIGLPLAMLMVPGGTPCHHRPSPAAKTVTELPERSRSCQTVVASFNGRTSGTSIIPPHIQLTLTLSLDPQLHLDLP